MPAPTAMEIRREIVKRHQDGDTLKIISQDLNVPYETVRKIWRHWRRFGKLTANYEQAKQRGTRRYQSVYEEAIEMKREHPKWGAQLIRLTLEKSHERLPSVRTLQRWFRAAGVSNSAKIQRSRLEVVRRGQQVHQVWAVDAKERMKLADESSACWLVVTDEASGAILGGEVFPPMALDKN
jgi:transposase